MDYVGSEALQSTANRAKMPPQKQVVAQIALDAEAGPASRQFQMRNAAVGKLRNPWSSEYRQERTRAAFCEVHQLPRSERNAVDLVKRLAKQRDARLRSHRPPSSFPGNARRTAGRILGLARSAIIHRNASMTRWKRVPMKSDNGRGEPSSLGTNTRVIQCARPNSPGASHSACHAPSSRR